MICGCAHEWSRAGAFRKRTVDEFDITWTVCYPWAWTSSRSRIVTPGIARSSSTPKSWLRDGRNLLPEALCWDIFGPTKTKSRAQPDTAGLCWTGEYRKPEGRRERERAKPRKNECVWERSYLEFCFGTTGRDLKQRQVKLYLWSKIAVFSIVPWKNCCSVELIIV